MTVERHAAEISAGEWVTVSGAWVNSREHGQQFKAAFLRFSPYSPPPLMGSRSTWARG
ncbi:MAG: hypothetical protein VKK97_08550 [Synechococcaceae cyanobacterium]|nr:hypothetical protein [Synechococcaceae cyanobacterium]